MMLGPGAAPAEPPAWLAAVTPRIEAEIHREIERARLPGLAIAIVSDDGVAWTGAYGMADLGQGIAMTADTRVGIGSISKLFTALAIMRLRDAGRLDLDDPVRRFLPWFRLKDDAAPAITIRELLLHLSGLPRDAPGASWADRTMPDDAALKAGLADLPAALPPEAQWKYSNLGYALLGLVVEAVSGEPYPAYLDHEILAPLGMTETGLGGSPGPTLALGYDAPVGGVRAARPPLAMGAVGPAGGIVSSARDLARLLGGMLAKDDAGPVGARTRREMLRAQAELPEGLGGQGLGFEIRARDHHVRIGHAGRAAGFTARLEIDPETGTGIAILINADDGEPTRLAGLIEAIVEPAQPRPPAPAEDPGWRDYVGRYRSAEGESGIVIADGRLAWIDPASAHPEASRIFLAPVARDRFKFLSGALVGEILTFDRNTEGRVIRMRAGGATDMRE